MPYPKHIRTLAAAISMVALFLFAGCEEIEEEKPWIHVDRPQMLFTDTTLLDCYDKDILSWKLKTAYLERWSDKEIVFMRPVLVDIYDSVGERVAFLRADSGRMDMKFTYVYAYGHVYALTPKGASVRADSLLWNKRDDQVRTDSYVRVVSEDGDVLQGKGFVSDARMDNWRILSNVTGIFQDAAKRMKEEDKKQAEELEKKPPAPPPAAAGPMPGAKPANAAPQKPAGNTPAAGAKPAPKKDDFDTTKAMSPDARKEPPHTPAPFLRAMNKAKAKQAMDEDAPAKDNAAGSTGAKPAATQPAASAPDAATQKPAQGSRERARRRE